MSEGINVNGNFAVMVGKMWASDGYNEINLHQNPKPLMSFKDAYDLSEKTGGKIVMFKPTELTDDQLADLKLAAAGQNNG